MPARQSANPQELSQGTHQSPAILQLLLFTICESLRHRSIGQQTPAFYVDDAQILLETHRSEQVVEESPANPQLQEPQHVDSSTDGESPYAK